MYSDCPLMVKTQLLQLNFATGCCCLLVMEIVLRSFRDQLNISSDTGHCSTVTVSVVFLCIPLLRFLIDMWKYLAEFGGAHMHTCVFHRGDQSFHYFLILTR